MRSNANSGELRGSSDEPLTSGTENCDLGVFVPRPNPTGFVAQTSGPETNLLATPAGGEKNRCFSSGNPRGNIGQRGWPTFIRLLPKHLVQGGAAPVAARAPQRDPSRAPRPG